jgi:DNA-binding NarL/FixJ family response regulator
MTAAAPWTLPVFTGEPRRVALTAVKADCLECIARGMKTPEIAGELLVTRNTVKTHIRGVLAALGARDRLQAAVFVWSGQVVVDVVSAPNEKSI